MFMKQPSKAKKNTSGTKYKSRVAQVAAARKDNDSTPILFQKNNYMEPDDRIPAS